MSMDLGKKPGSKIPDRLLDALEIKFQFLTDKKLEREWRDVGNRRLATSVTTQYKSKSSLAAPDIPKKRTNRQGQVVDTDDTAPAVSPIAYHKIIVKRSPEDANLVAM